MFGFTCLIPYLEKFIEDLNAVFYELIEDEENRKEDLIEEIGFLTTMTHQIIKVIKQNRSDADLLESLETGRYSSRLSYLKEIGYPRIETIKFIKNGEDCDLTQAIRLGDFLRKELKQAARFESNEELLAVIDEQYKLIATLRGEKDKLKEESDRKLLDALLDTQPVRHKLNNLRLEGYPVVKTVKYLRSISGCRLSLAKEIFDTFKSRRK